MSHGTQNPYIGVSPRASHQPALEAFRQKCDDDLDSLVGHGRLRDAADGLALAGLDIFHVLPRVCVVDEKAAIPVCRSTITTRCDTAYHQHEIRIRHATLRAIAQLTSTHRAGATRSTVWVTEPCHDLRAFARSASFQKPSPNAGFMAAILGEAINARRVSKVIVISTSIAVVAALSLTPAFAEGSRNASFSNVHPGFSSQFWADHQVDSANTVITWSNCTKSNGTAVTSVEVKLVDQWGALPDATVGNYRTLGKCGSSTWLKNSSNYTLRDSTFYWEFGRINGTWGVQYLSGNSRATY
jgi:hypothetical protein